MLQNISLLRAYVVYLSLSTMSAKLYEEWKDGRSESLMKQRAYQKMQKNVLRFRNRLAYTLPARSLLCRFVSCTMLEQNLISDLRMGGPCLLRFHLIFLPNVKRPAPAAAAGYSSHLLRIVLALSQCWRQSRRKYARGIQRQRTSAHG